MNLNIYFQAFTVRTWRKRLSNLNTFLTPHIYWGIHIKICVNYNQHNEDAITLAQEFAHEGKPIAAICHGAWLLVNAGLVAGKTAAPCRYIAADIENAGGHYVDEQLHVDDANGFKLITSRKPDDLDYFVDAIKDALK